MDSDGNHGQNVEDWTKRWGLRPVELADKPLFDEAFSLAGQRLSDYTFANTYIWRNGLRLYWASIEGHLCVFANGTGDLTMLFPPLGEGNLARCVDICFEMMNEYNARVAHPSHSRIEYVSEGLLRPLSTCGGLKPALMGGDYVYETAKMIDLPGGDLKSKRQARNKFLREHAVRTEPLTRERVGECLALLQQWQRRAEQHGAADDPLARVTAELRRRDTSATELALAEHEALGLTGMVLYADERLIGFTLGEPLSPEQCSILIEKTDLEVYGSAQFIFSEFCRQYWSSYPECNVGDDWGIPSLKWTKESYRPLKLLSKYVLTREATPMVGWRPPGEAVEPAPINPVNPQHMTAAGVPADRESEAVRIERATLADLDALVDLEARTFPAADAINRRQMRYLLRSPRALVAVARTERRVAGWVIALIRRHPKPKYETARIYSLAVDPEYRGRGIGERLVRYILDELETLGVGRCFLEVAQDNEPAKALYGRLGFTTVATLPNYYGEGAHGWRMLRLAREGTPGPAAATVPRPLGLV